MATNDTLAVETRAHTGTTSAKALRHAGKIPATLYGHGAEPLSIAIDRKAFDELLHAGGKNHLLSLTLDGKSADTAVVRDVQRDPLSRHIVHADLQRVGATESISASLPIVAVGVPIGVKDHGAVLDILVHTLDVKAPANAVPEHIEVDVSELDVHGHITAAQIALPSGVTLDIAPETLIVSVEASRTAQQVEDTTAAATPAAVPTIAESTPAASGS